MQFYLTVKGIVERDGKILVLKRSALDDHLPGVWETPGGGVDKEESPQEALKREILEETGLVVTIGRPFNVFTFRKDTGEFKVGITFLCKYESGEVKLSEEHPSIVLSSRVSLQNYHPYRLSMKKSPVMEMRYNERGEKEL